MAEAPSLIYNDAPGAIPANYRFPPGLDARLSSVSATFNGAGASGDFLACLAVYSQDGKLIGRYFPGSPVASGDSAEVTFAPFLREATPSASGGAGLQFNAGTYGADNVGDFSTIEADDEIVSGFTNPSNGDPIGFSLAITTLFGILLTAIDGNAQVLEVDNNPTTASVNARGIGVNTKTHSGPSNAIDVFYGNFNAMLGNTFGYTARGVSVTSGASLAVDVADRNNGTGTSGGVKAESFATGGGDSVGVRSRARVSGGGAAYTYQGYDSAGALVFAVDDAGNVHIPVGAAVINDL